MLSQAKIIMVVVALSLLGYAIYAIHDHGKESGRNEIMAKWDKQKEKDLIALQKANSEVEFTKKNLLDDINEITRLSVEKENHDKTIIDNLKRDVANGEFRLRATIKRHQAELNNNTATEHGEATGELLPAITFNLLSLAGRANAEVYRTNKCIDSYNKVKDALDRLATEKED
jgi:hypothetical protein